MKMFNNIGEKIKGSAMINFIISFIVTCIISTRTIIDSNGEAIGIGILIVVIGSVLSLFIAYVTYGFGQLIETTNTIAYTLNKHIHKTTKEQNEENRINKVPASVEHKFRCDKCFSLITDYPCPKCKYDPTDEK